MSGVPLALSVYTKIYDVQKVPVMITRLNFRYIVALVEQDAMLERISSEEGYYKANIDLLKSHFGNSPRLSLVEF